MILEAIDPTYVKSLIESINEVVKSLSHLSTTLQNITRGGFDESSRVRTRVEYLDDGYVRVRDTSATIDILEMLKEFSWGFYNLAEVNALLSRFSLDDNGRVAIQNPPNLDVALSTRASEETLSALSGKFPSADVLSDTIGNPRTTILGSALLGFDGTYWRRVRVDTSSRLKVSAEVVANPPNLDVALSTRASESTLSGIKAGTDYLDDIYGRLDVTMSTLAKLARHGRSVSPSWVLGSEMTAPGAGTSLVSKTVTSGRTGYVYGLAVSAGEANDFKLVWTSGGTSRSYRIVLSTKGTVLLVSPVPVNEGLAADGGTTISVQNVNAGSSGVVYQAMLLYAEV